MKRLASAFIGIWLLLWPGVSFAIDPDLALDQLRQRSWSSDDGVVNPGVGVAQTPDGFLWVPTVTGLYRFDGQRFDPVPSASTDGRFSSIINTVFVSRSGQLWVGYASGGVAVLRNGRLIDMHMPEAVAQITNFTEGADGAIWVQSGRQQHALTRYLGGVWRQFGPADGLPDDWLLSVFGARDGSIWVTNRTTLFVMPRSGSRFIATRERLSSGTQIAQDRAGNMWLSGPEGTRMAPDYARNPNAAPSSVAYPTPAIRSSGRLMFDRDGTLWISIWDQGVYRIRNPQALPSLSAEARAAAIETYSSGMSGQPLTGSIAAYEDREGNVWLTHDGGLTRLSAPKIVLETRIPLPIENRGYQFIQGLQGQLYVANTTTVYEILPGQSPAAVISGLDAPQLLCADRSGGLWYLNDERLYRRTPGSVTRMAPPTDGYARFVSCIEDRSGRMLFFGQTPTLRMLEHGAWRTIDLPQFGDTPIRRVLFDRQGNIIGQRRAAPLVRISGDRFEDLYSRGAVTVAQIGSFEDTAEGLLILGDTGASRLTNGTAVNLRHEQYPWLGYSVGFVRARDGHTWIWTGAGVVRVRTDQLNRMFDVPGYQPAYELFTRDDGLPSNSFGRGAGWLRIAQGGDGRIWITTKNGVARIDPAHLQRNTIAPALYFRTLSADGVVIGDPGATRLKPGTSRIEIDYAAASFTMPERVRYRYRLEGVEPEWVEAGQRQEAFYTNLKPGHYTFSVMAANEDGVWGQAKTISFTIPPTFLQSWAFLILCLIAGALVIWALFNLRVRQVTERLNARLAERLAERERIARELHDTLLQGFHGLMMHFQAVAESIPKRSPARPMMEEALDRADAVLIEGRDRVQDLRMQAAGGLANVLAAAAQRLKMDADVVTITEEGAPRDLPPGVLEEVSRVGEEALANALRHAKATAIDIAIVYGPRQLRLAVTDNGVGLDDAVAEAGQRPGHFGLVGMRERAAALRGDLAVLSRPGGGVEVVLLVPAHVAYGGGASLLERLGFGRWPSWLSR